MIEIIAQPSETGDTTRPKVRLSRCNCDFISRRGLGISEALIDRKRGGNRRGRAWGHTSTINNCIDVRTAITQNRSSVRCPFPSSWRTAYHVMNRGIGGRRLFPDNKANEHFR